MLLHVFDIFSFNVAIYNCELNHICLVFTENNSFFSGLVLVLEFFDRVISVDGSSDVKCQNNWLDPECP